MITGSRATEPLSSIGSRLWFMAWRALRYWSSVADPMTFGAEPRIRGSMPLTNGSGFGSCYFRHWNANKKLLKVHLHHFPKIKSQKKPQNGRNQGFLTIFAWWSKDPEPDSYLWLMDPDPDPGGPKTYGSGIKMYCRLGTIVPVLGPFSKDSDPDSGRICFPFFRPPC